VEPSDGFLTTIPYYFSRFLNNNKLTMLEKGSLDNLTSLEYLKMNKNKLSIIPKDVFQKMINLKYL
jgi:Leucine-rich repeat (LRR) protein